MDVAAYLRRLGIEEPATPSLPALRALQRAHLERVPFENSSVLRGEPIVLDPERLVAKLVRDGRGGFCFELNGAFAALLKALGYEVALLPGRFWSSEGLGPPNEHLALRVHIDGESWLVDVGAGYSFLEPLRLVIGPEQDDPNGRFRITAAADEPGALDVEWQHRDGAFRPHYRFEDRPVAMDAFVEVCEHLRTSPDSPFPRGWICARALPLGWATLDGTRLVVTQGASRTDETVEGEALDAALERWFSVPSARSRAGAPPAVLAERTGRRVGSRPRSTETRAPVRPPRGGRATRAG
jgi:N-hydroxyarylamine O-acetyltransferase